MRQLRPSAEDALRTALASAVHRSNELRFVHRLHAVLLVSLGHSCYEVARWFGEDPRSIERWTQAYSLHGDEGLRDHQRGRRPTRLTAQQSQQLALEVARDPDDCGYHHSRWTGKLLSLHLQRRYGVQLGQRHCQRLLRATRT